MVVGQELDKYSQDVAKACEVCVQETGDDMVKELKKVKSSSFSGDYTRGWKKFPRAWTFTFRSGNVGAVQGTVHLKKPMYRIGHLLEFEHKQRDGGKTQGSHFIEPISKEFAKRYEEKMIELIGKVV